MSLIAVNGIHAYWLLNEPIEGPLEIERVIKGIARALGGDLAVSDLSRVMRLPGFLNVKDPANPKLCKILSSSNPNIRYSIDDFIDYKDNPGAVECKKHTMPYDGPIGDIKRVRKRCKFMHYCRDNASTISEPLWYAMISNLARLEGGSEEIHRVSKPYPKYSPDETDNKIDHALKNTGPHTCEYIKAIGLDGCPADGCGVKSPAVLGIKKDIEALIEEEASYESILKEITKIPLGGEREK